MASGEMVIQSMWSPAVTAVRSKGIPCVYQPLKEGYRSWGGGLRRRPSASRAHKLDAAYEYINWFLSGWVGGYLNRQGYYSAVLATAKENMRADEWGFWMEGKPAEGRHQGARRHGDGEGRRRARRRLLRRPHGQRRLLERRHGRERLHGPQVERVHRRLMRCTLQPLAAGGVAGTRTRPGCLALGMPDRAHGRSRANAVTRRLAAGRAARAGLRAVLPAAARSSIVDRQLLGLQRIRDASRPSRRAATSRRSKAARPAARALHDPEDLSQDAEVLLPSSGCSPC